MEQLGVYVYMIRRARAYVLQVVQELHNIHGTEQLISFPDVVS
jgi:hypothetical protein